MDYLWTPWRYRYVTEPKDGNEDPARCIFCRILTSGRSDEENLIVHRGERNFIILNRFPYTNGHMMVIPYDHLARLADAPVETAEEMMRLTRRLELVLRSLYRPQGVNVGMNIGRAAGAGVAGHIHMHVLPRWIADSNFATVIGETRVHPESLEDTWNRARAEFARTRA